MLITADTVVTGRELLRPGWIDVADGRVRAVGVRAAAAARPTWTWARSRWCPGSWTCTCTAAGGRVPGGRRRSRPRRRAVDLHRRHGTTTMIASLVTAHPAELLRQVRRAGRAGAVRPGRRHPPGRSLAGRGTLRRPRAVRAARPGSGRTRPGPRRRRAAPSGWSPWPRTDRWPRRDPADRGRRRGRRGRAHRGHLRPGAGRDRRRARPSPPTCSTRCGRCTTVSRARCSR